MSDRKIIKQINKHVLPRLTTKLPVFCITGPMASGKNYVSSIFENMGFVSLDLDKEVHKVLEEKKEDVFSAFEKIAESRSIKIRCQDNSLDRRALGSLLFSDPTLLKKQEDIIYPALTENVKNYIKEKTADKNNRPRGIILNATVLFKTPALLKKCGFILYVHANWIKRFNRARKRDHMNELEILQRFTAQKGLLQKYQSTKMDVVVVRN